MTPSEIQRLVDGECNARDRVTLLGSLDMDSRQWRALALALLEDDFEQEGFGIFKPVAERLAHVAAQCADARESGQGGEGMV